MSFNVDDFINTPPLTDDTATPSGDDDTNSPTYTIENAEITDLRGSGWDCDMTNDEFSDAVLDDGGNLNPQNFCGPCPKGFYCPVTFIQRVEGLSIIECPKDYFCRGGNSEPKKCFFLQSCNAKGLDAPQTAESAVFVVLFICFLFIAIPFGIESIRLYRLKQTRDKSEGERRKKNKEDKQVVKDRDAQNTTKNIIFMLQGDAYNDGKGADNVVYHVSANVRMKLLKWANFARDQVSKRREIAQVFNKTGKKRDPILLTFRMMSVFATSNVYKDGEYVEEKKYFLNNATGYIRPGKITAVMGPSGCGKSTLISVLTNRVKANMRDGSIYINDDLVDPAIVNKVCGFVPQEDIMNSGLTVKENLMYQCELRHDPNHLSDAQERKNLVNEVILCMGLTKVRHSIIGGANTGKRGISGGQKKRVNIAMEFMHNPRLLFLDEPTSGLDASMSSEFLEFIKNLAIATGVGVAMVIHQPNMETFRFIDDVILMQPTDDGGRIAYCGPVPRAIKYFNPMLRYPIQSTENPADRFIDLLSEGIPIHDREGNKNRHEALYADFYDEDYVYTGEVWYVLEHPNSQREYHRASRGGSVKDAYSNLDKKYAKASLITETQFEAMTKKYARSKPEWHVVAYYSGMMFLNTQMNSSSDVIKADVSISFMAILLSLMNMGDRQLMFVINLLYGLVAGLYGASIFKDDAVLTRYLNSGISSTALFLGTILASIPRMLFQNATFNVPYKNVSAPGMPGTYLFAITFLGQIIAYCIGMSVCVSFPHSGADVYTVLLMMMTWTYSGLAPRARDLAQAVPGIIGLNMSFCRWMFGAETIIAACNMNEAGRFTEGYVLERLGIIGIKSIGGRYITAPYTYETTTSFQTTTRTGVVEGNIPTYTYDTCKGDYDSATSHQSVIFVFALLIAASTLAAREIRHLIHQFFGDIDESIRNVVKDNMTYLLSGCQSDHRERYADYEADESTKDNARTFQVGKAHEKRETKRVSNIKGLSEEQKSNKKLSRVEAMNLGIDMEKYDNYPL
jgi:ABC-type multidrug transport system ATPase subunit